MGALLSSLVPEEKQARIHELVQEAVKTFSTAFASAYKTALINKVKEDAQPSEDGPEYQLAAPEEATWVLKAGTVTKQSDVIKQWRARHFVARNAADNYRIDCYVGNESGKLTATINLCGYTPEDFSEAGIEFGLRLVPEDSRRRVWRFKCASAEERKEWSTLLAANCVVAEPPLSKDPIVQEAFTAAYDATRLHYGFYHTRPIVGTEDETLGSLVLDLVHREVVDGVLEGISQPMLRSTVQGSIEKSILGSVSAAWKSALSAAEPSRATVESAAKASLSGIFEKEAEVKAKVTESIGEKLDPFLTTQGEKVFKPVCATLITPVAECMHATLGGVKAALKALVKAEGFTVFGVAGAGRDDLFHAVSNEIAAWGGAVQGAADKSAALTGGTSEAISKIAGLLGENLPLHALRNKIMEKNAQLATNAVHTFSIDMAQADVVGKEAITADYAGVIDAVLAKATHDAKIYTEELIVDIINSIVSPPLAEEVIVPCASTALAPIQETIDALPGGLNDFFDANSMLEDVVEDSLNNAVTAAVQPYKGEMDGVIDAPLEPPADATTAEA